MADDVRSGRTHVAIEEEVARVWRRLWPGPERRWIVFAPDGRHATMGWYTEPTEPEISQVEANLRELGGDGWLAVLHGTYYDPGSGLELRMVRQLGEPGTEWETAVARFLDIRAAALREGR